MDISKSLIEELKLLIQLKEKIVEIHQKWSALSNSLSEFKHAEY